MRFVIQEHNAIHAGLHYDFRLEEENGVFKSWVVPKLAAKLPWGKGTCALAIQVNDHSEECAYYEGEYGPGYGEGTVKIWDQGIYEGGKVTDNKWNFTLSGNILIGRFTLIKSREEDKWFLCKVD